MTRLRHPARREHDRHPSHRRRPHLRLHPLKRALPRTKVRKEVTPTDHVKRVADFAPTNITSVADFRARRREMILIVFSDDMRVRKNTSRSANVRACGACAAAERNPP